MEYLQYNTMAIPAVNAFAGFKPCYKWNTFNTEQKPIALLILTNWVLNLVINGIPSIPAKALQ